MPVTHEAAGSSPVVPASFESSHKISKNPQPISWRQAAPWATLALLAALCVGCGGGNSNSSAGSANSTPAGTHALTVAAKSGSLTQTAQIALNVQ